MKKILPILLSAFLVGLIYLLPHALLYGNTSPQRIYLPFSFAETLYAAQVKEVEEGHVLVGDPQFLEHKNTTLPIFPLLPVWIIATMSVIAGSTSRGFLLSDFIFPITLWLLIAGFVRSLIRKKGMAVFVATFTLTFNQLVAKFPPLSLEGWQKLVYQLFLFNITQPLPFYRTPNPQISFIFLVLSLWVLWLLWQKVSLKKWLITLILGVSLYFVYFYHVTYFMAVVGILVVVSVLSKRYHLFFPLIIILVIQVFLGLVYLQITNRAEYATLAITGGRFETRYFDWLFSLRYGLTVGILFWFRRSLNKVLYMFLFALTGAGLIVVNLQVFTGWTMQPGHWPQTTIEPLIMIVVGTLLFSLIPSVRRQVQIATWGTMLLLTYAMGIQIRFASIQQGQWSIPRDLNYVLSWLDKNSPEQSVVVSLDIETLAYLPVLTSVNIFLPIEEYHYATIDEIWERLLYAYKLYSVPNDVFDPSRLAIPTYFELTYNVNQYKHADWSEYEPQMTEKIKKCYPSLCSGLYGLPQHVIREMKDRYKNIRYDSNPYRVDYAIYSDREKKLGAHAPKGDLVFTSGTYRVYRLSP